MISRRRFTAAATASTIAAVLPGSIAARASDLAGDGWRRFEVTTRLDVVDTDGPAQAWIPLPAFDQRDWVRSEDSRWTADSRATIGRDADSGASMVRVRWEEGPRFAEVTSTVLTRDRPSALTAPQTDAVLSADERSRYLQGSAAAPTDGIVKATADRITTGRSSDLERARALYDWVVENTFRSAPVRGCGEGNVEHMLRSGALGGKCADINPLFVALARAAGLPARDLYGIRVAPSRLGYGSLGPSGSTVTKAQHCRAEVFLSGFGWTAMDPADVRKVMLEEAPGGLPIDHPKVVAARARLFGSWEGNWVPYNAANDVSLPGRQGDRLNFLMYPQIETASGLRDCYEPDRLRYSITARELAI